MEQFIIRISRFLNFAAGWGIVAIMALVVSNVLSRTLFNSPILGTSEYVGLLTGAIIGLSLAYCSLQKGHIAIGLLVDKLKPKTQAVIGFLNNLIALLFLAFTSYHLLKYARRLWLSGEVSPTTETPFYPFVYLIAAGLIVFSLTIALDLTKNVKRVIGK